MYAINKNIAAPITIRIKKNKTFKIINKVSFV